MMIMIVDGDYDDDDIYCGDDDRDAYSDSDRWCL